MTPSLLRLFIYSAARYQDTASVVPRELRQRLLKFVPEPAAPGLDTLDELPESHALEETSYSLADDDDGIVVVMGKRAYQMPRKPPKKRSDDPSHPHHSARHGARGQSGSADGAAFDRPGQGDRE